MRKMRSAETGHHETQEQEFLLLEEDTLTQQMTETTEPYLDKWKQEGYLSGLYYELFPCPQAKGTVVISYGFTESTVKYHEMIYYLHRQGYQIAILDHRGHGKSLREGKTGNSRERNVVYVRHFQQYVEDFHSFVHEVVCPVLLGVKEPKDSPVPLFLYGHSMGGCIAVRYLETYPGEFSKAVLNAPMLGLNMGKCPRWAALLACSLNIWLGRGKERVFFHGDFQPEEAFEDSASDSRARHAYYHAIRCKIPDYQTSSASYCWAREAIRAGREALRPRNTARVTIPVLLFQAGKDDLVLSRAQELFIRRIPDGRLVTFPNTKHEIYCAENHVLLKYYDVLLSFLDTIDF